MTVKLDFGSVTIHRIVEQEGPFFEVLKFFPTLTKEMLEENRSWLQPRFFDPADKLVLCIQSYLVQTPHHNILIDTCVGNHKPRPARPFWNMMKSDRYEKSLAAAGLRRRRHRLRHVHAPARRPRRLEHAARQRPLGADLPQGALRVRRSRARRTGPKAEGRRRELSLDHRIRCCRSSPPTAPTSSRATHAFNDLVTLIPTPGHTIDHYSVQVGKPGADAVITGDMIHSPLQARYPELGMMSTTTPSRPGRSRRELFGRFCDTSTLMCTAHFPSPSTGRVTRWGDGLPASCRSERGCDGSERVMPAFICTACGTQYPPSEAPPAECPVCEDERQFMPPGGQAWTTLERLGVGHLNAFRQHEPGLIGIGTQPPFAIGQRALLVCTPHGNVLWDCISLLDAATVTLINGLGGLKAIAISHPALLHDAGRVEPRLRRRARASARRRPALGHAARSLHQALAGRDARAAAGRDADPRRRTFSGRHHAALGAGRGGPRRRLLGRHRHGEPGPQVLHLHAQLSELHPAVGEGRAGDRRGAGAVPVRPRLQPLLRPGHPDRRQADPAGIRSSATSPPSAAPTIGRDRCTRSLSPYFTRRDARRPVGVRRLGTTMRIAAIGSARGDDPLHS